MAIRKKEIKLLIVDDDKLSRIAIDSVFKSSMFTFKSMMAEDAASAETALQENNFDCVILDYLLTDSDGIEIVEWMKEQNIFTPVVMLTGMGDEMIAVKAMKAGVYDYLSKVVVTDPEYSSILINAVIRAIELFEVKAEKHRARHSLEMREERYRGLVENSPILILRFFPDDCMISFVNDGYCHYFNTTRQEALGNNFFDIIPEDLKLSAGETINTLSQKNSVVTFKNYSTEDDSKRWQIWTIQALFGEDGEILEYQCMGKDITDIKNAESELNDQKLYLQSILDSQDNMIVVCSREEILLANSSFLNFFGYESADDLKKVSSTIPGLAEDIEGYETNGDMNSWIDSAIEKPDEPNLIAFMQKNREQPKIFSAVVSKLMSDRERFVIAFTNVTELEKKSKRFEHKASFDSLTKIYNRQKFEELITVEIKSADISSSELSVIFFDIDHFKEINDTHGHDVGDSVLVELTSIVKNNIRESDSFARWGGEEFILLLPMTDFKFAITIGEKIRKLVMDYDFKHVKNVTCSFGISFFSPGDSIESVIKRADTAMYRAKEVGRNKVVASRKKSFIRN